MSDVSSKKFKGFMFLGIAVCALLTLYAVIGFWVAPHIVQSMGSKLVKEKTGLNLTFQNVRLNPFTFTAEFEEMSLGQAGKIPFLKVEQLFADFEFGSLFTPPYRFRLIRLVSAEERLTILPDGRLDFAPLFEEISKQTARSRRVEDPPEILIENMRVETSRIIVVDPARSDEPIVTVSPLSGEFTNLSTVKGQKGTYDLRGTIVDIGRIHDSGRVSLAPLRLEGRFEIDVRKLRPVLALMGEAFPFEVPDGSLGLGVSYVTEKQKDRYALEVRDGNISLEGIQFVDKQQGFVFGALAKLTVRGLGLDTTSKQAAVEELTLTGTELIAWLRPDGRSGLLDVLTVSTADISEPETGTRDVSLPPFLNGWQARLKKVEIQKASFRYEDHRRDHIEAAEILSIPRFTVDGVSIDTGRKRLVIQDVAATDTYFFEWLNPDGSLGINSVLGRTPSKATAPESGLPQESQERPVFVGWQAQLNRAELQNATMIYEDRTLKTPMKWVLSPVHGKVTDLSFPQLQPATVSLDIVGEGGGRLAISGTAGIHPPSADLNVSLNRLALRQIQPIVDTASRLEITGGTLNVVGRAATTGDSEGPKFRFEGELTASDLSLLDTKSAKPIFRQEELQINGIRFDVKPNRLVFDEVVNRRPYVYMVIEEDGSTNLENALKLEDENVDAIEKSLLGQMVDFIAQQIQGPVPIRVTSARIEEGAMQVIHKLPEATFDMTADQVDARFGKIDTETDDMVDVTVRGRVDEEAPFEAKGQVDPFGEALATELAMTFKNYNTGLCTNLRPK